MIVVDTSAIMAIFNDEPEAVQIASKLSGAEAAYMAAPTRLELTMVAVGRKEEPGRAMAEELLARYNISVVDWTETHASIAAEAFLRFGKGRHHAALNFGDCISYAVAKTMDAPLLFKGDAFSKTDVKSAL